MTAAGPADWVLALIGSVPADAEVVLRLIARIAGMQYAAFAERRAQAARREFDGQLADTTKVPELVAIRVVHLLNHTSSDTPGQRYSYDGNRFALLSQVVESASGRKFGELVCERIIKKLELEQTAPNILDPQNFSLAGLDPAKFEARLARPYQLAKDGRYELIEYRPHFNCSAGLISNVLDVCRFSMALDAGQLLSPQSLARAMTKSVTTDGRKTPYGLGWFVLERDGVTFVWHYGLWVGDSALIIKVPERKLTYVVLANSERLTSSYFHGRGELMTSPFARAFIEGFVTSDGTLPEDAISP
jgi:CubicO group peptidase (beta-lactamase class C family)